MLQQEKADDYVISTNETHSVREFLEAAFAYVGLDWKRYVEIDPRYYRPAEVDLLIGDYAKAKRQLGWEPKTRFVDLVKLMVDADVDLLRRHREGQIKVAG
jgi:GDPmannose 4,6-dehydratase